MGVDPVVGVVEVERRQWQRQVEVRLVEARDGADVGPVAAVREGEDPVAGERRGDDLLAEVGVRAADQHLAQDRGAEDVDPHAGEERARAARRSRGRCASSRRAPPRRAPRRSSASRGSWTTRPSGSRWRMPKPGASARVTGLTAMVMSASRSRWTSTKRRCPSGRAGRRRGSGLRTGCCRRSAARGSGVRRRRCPGTSSRLSMLCCAARMLTKPPRKASKR